MKVEDAVSVVSGAAGLFGAVVTVAFFPAGESAWPDAAAGFCVVVGVVVGGQNVFAGVGPRTREFLVSYAVLFVLVAALTGSPRGAVVGVGTVLALGAAADRWREALRRAADLADRRELRAGRPGRRGVVVRTPSAVLRARGARNRVVFRFVG